jgi:hypothetical protein
MGQTASSFVAGTINLGATFEILEYQVPGTDAQRVLLTQAMHQPTHVIEAALQQVLAHHPAHLAACRARILEWGAYPFMDAFLNGRLDLKVDKSSRVPRFSAFTRGGAVVNVRSHCMPLCELLISNQPLDASDLFAAMGVIYTDEWHAQYNAPDVVIYDTVAAMAVVQQRDAYRALTVLSPYIRDAKLITEDELLQTVRTGITASIAAVVDGPLATTPYAGVFAVPECRNAHGMDIVFPNSAWTLRSDYDPLNPIALVGMGTSVFVENLTDAMVRFVAPLAPHPSYKRLVAAKHSIDDKTNIVTIGIHWKENDPKIVAIAVQTLLSAALHDPTVQMAMVTGDFNHPSKEAAKEVTRYLHGFGTRVTPLKDGEPITTKVACRDKSCQFEKVGVEIAAPKTCQYFQYQQRSDTDLVETHSGVINNGTRRTPSIEWPIDHGGAVASFGEASRAKPVHAV